MDETLATKIIGEIAATKRIPVESITIDSTFDELAMDSLDAMNLLFTVEEKFGVSIPDDVANSIRTVRGAVMEVEKLLAERAEAQS